MVIAPSGQTSLHLSHMIHLSRRTGIISYIPGNRGSVSLNFSTRLQYTWKTTCGQICKHFLHQNGTVHFVWSMSILGNLAGNLPGSTGLGLGIFKALLSTITIPPLIRVSESVLSERWLPADTPSRKDRSQNIASGRY